LAAQLKPQIGQLHEQIAGLQEQTSANSDEIQLIQDELVGVGCRATHTVHSASGLCYFARPVSTIQQIMNLIGR
jgi:hypothetical protein